VPINEKFGARLKLDVEVPRLQNFPALLRAAAELLSNSREDAAAWCAGRYDPNHDLHHNPP